MRPSVELPTMDYASLIQAIRADVRELPFESTIRGAVVIRRLGADLPESESVPGLSAAQCVIEAVRRTISEPHEVHPMPDQFGEGHVLVFCRHVTEGPRRWEFEVEVAVDPERRAVIADARVTRPEEGFEDSDWTTPPPVGPAVLPVGLVACPCCGHATLTERGGYEICPVCFWEDDGQDNEHADQWRGGPNRVSLREGRVNFRRFGASVEADCESVRRPTPEEVQLRRFDEEGTELTNE
jgi:cysteine-rich CPCC protein